MKIVIKCFLVFFALSSSFEVVAQQSPQYTQYMYSISVIKPGYAGSNKNLSMGLLYRKQWADCQGVPAAGTFFGHTRVGKNVGLGLSFINDKLGPITENKMDPDDPAFGEDSNSTLFNFGLGAYYYTDRYYVGLGMSNMLKGYYLNYGGRQFG